jgi:hypothetical protein
MNSAYRSLEEGHASLIDTPPKGLGQIEASAWVLGYLYAYTQQPCPTEIQVIYDATFGNVYEVTEGDGGKKVGYLVANHKGRFIPTRIYER